MEQIIQWLSNYSMPVVLLLILGAILIFDLRMIVEKAVESQFNERGKRIELLLERRSSFEEKILLDQYNTVNELQSKLGNIGADINRMRSGIKVKGLMVGTDIVPLTGIYLELAAKQFLLKKEFYDLLLDEANNLLAYANASQQEEVEELAGKYMELNGKFHDEMKRSFGIDRINWSALDPTR